MTRFISFGCLMGLMAGALLVAPARADDDSASVARLEALLEAQQRQIEALEQQLASAQEADTDVQRVEMMREQIRVILSEEEFRESLMPSLLQAGYDDGFFIRSTDDKFLMRIGGGLQVRYTYYHTRGRNRWLLPRTDRNDRSGFDLQRARLRFDGHVYDEDLTYMLEFAADAWDGYDVVMNEAWVNYRFQDELQFRAGLMRLPSTRNQMVNELEQQSIDRPMVDTVYGFGYGIGAMFWGQLAEKRLEYYLAVVNGVANGERTAANRTITVDPFEHDNSPAILFRFVWHALGEDPEDDFDTMHDRPQHKSAALDFGFHYVFNEDDGDLNTTLIPLARRTLLPGGFGLVPTHGLQIHQFGLDTSFKYCGFSATGEYILRLVDVRNAWRAPFSPWWLQSGDGSTTAQHGAYVQAGYFLPIEGLEDKLEVIARVGGVSALSEAQECAWEYSAGVNYYFEDDVKLQADLTYVDEVPITSSYSSLANVNDDALILRVQFQVAF